MSSELANNLLRATSVAAFWREQGEALSWQSFAALKGEIDRLTVCDLDAAQALAARLAELARLAAQPLAQAFADASRARVLRQQGRDREANALYEAAVKTLRRARLSTEAAMIQKQQVEALKYLGRFDEALRTARSARRALAKGSPVQLAQLETNVGNVYYQLDRYKRALAHYDRAREIFATTGDDAMRATVDFGRANILTELDRPDEALVLLEGAAATYEREGQRAYAAQSRFHIAYIHFLKGNYNLALTLYDEAREQLQRAGNRQLVAWCDLEIAEILLALNAFEDALENGAKARKHFRELGQGYEAAKAAMVEALAATGLRQFEVAERDLLEARAAFAAQKNRTFTALADTYLAELAIHCGDTEAAMRRAEAAMRVFAKQRLATRAAQARLLAARAAFDAGRLAKAGRLTHSALRGVEQLYAPSLTFKIHHLKGQLEQAQGRTALPHFRRAVAEIEQLRGGVATDDLKTTFLRDKIAAYEDAIKACLDESSRLRAAREADDSASERSAKDQSEEPHSAALLEEAFQLVEAAKSRSLADLLARYAQEREASPTADAAHDEARARLAKLIEELNWYNAHAGLEDDKGDQRRVEVAERYRREVARCERQIAQLFRRLQAASSSLAAPHKTSASASAASTNAASTASTAAASTAASGKPGDVSLRPSGKLFGASAAERTTADDLRAALAQDEVAIEYFITGDDISAFVASPQEINIFRNLASRAAVEKTLAGLRFQIEKFNYGAAYVEAHFGQLKRSVDGHLAQLYQTLFAPLAGHLKQDKLVIIPHGALHYLPFHALRDGAEYLVERLEISYAPSAAVFNLCRQKAGKSPRSGKSKIKNRKSKIEMLALGVSESGTPSILEEMAALQSLFPNSRQFVGAAATRDNLQRFAPQARFLHLASHGYFRRDNPMFSFLKLADANLNFYNLMDLRLDAELVTLSACHTGVNAIFPGDELHGLMRGFLSAGAPAMVVSLWAVNDRSTTELMSRMYAGIKAGESRRAALRRAQLAVKEEYGHPYYWAPFILMGETGDTEAQR